VTPNELLLWLSARKHGSWPQFRDAVATLDLAAGGDETGDGMQLSLHQRIKLNLERLGHVEFDTAGCEEGWRTVPPAMALSQTGGRAIAVLCGARTPALLEKLDQAAYGLALERAPQPDCPDVIRICADESGELTGCAARAGLRCQAEAPAALLSHLPPVDSLRGWKAVPLPAMGKNWEVKQFQIDRKQMKWNGITIQEANASSGLALFCFTRFQVPHYFLREGSATLKLSGAAGKYYVLYRRQKRVLKYDSRLQRLTMPAIFRPPLLTERALILCSGFPPSVDTCGRRPMLTYHDIPEDIAGLAAAVLRQDSL
jgi:hypothetical protein